MIKYTKNRRYVAFVFTALCTVCIERYCYSKSSVRLSVCLSVRDVDLPCRVNVGQFESNYRNN